MRTSSSTGAFTLIEIMVAMSLFAIVMTLALPCYRYIFQNALACSKQLDYTAISRQSAQKIQRLVEMGTGVSAFTNGLGVYISMGNTYVASIGYVDLDSNTTTLASSILVYTPDITATNGKVTLCMYVSKIAGTSMFSVNNMAPQAVSLAYHVGDTTNMAFNRLTTLEGYQGIEVRMSASPRNIPTCYTEL